MFRTMLRVLGGLMFLVSFATLMTARGPQGEPSPLERIPALMQALEARVAARHSVLPPGSSVDSDMRPHDRPAPSMTSDRLSVARTDVGPLPPDEDAASLGPPAPRLPSRAGSVTVHRGLP
jgi:hypothetical protein